MGNRPDRRLLAPDEVAAICGLSRKAVYRAIERGELRASRLCSRLRITPEDLDDWIDASQVEPTAPPAPPPPRAPAPNGLRALLREPGPGVAA
jgi:excisionase family DNA binding protein